MNAFDSNIENSILATIEIKAMLLSWKLNFKLMIFTFLSMNQIMLLTKYLLRFFSSLFGFIYFNVQMKFVILFLN